VAVEIGLIASFAVFAFTMSASPGPNNTVLLAQSAQHGVRRALPYFGGILVGMALLLTVFGSGLGAVFLAAPWLMEILRWAGFAYLLYLAWRIAMAAPPEDSTTPAKPVGFFASVAFQWLNPKAWVAIGVYFTSYVPVDQGFSWVLLGTVVFVAMIVPGAALWLFAGRALARLVRSFKAHRVFSIAMAIALVLSMLPVLFS
jgi:threonine/homoserine/homoserine lactone efflux protein